MPDEVDFGRVQARVDLMRSCAYEASRVTEWLQVFVSCFCEQGDLLGQWRGYGQTAGYSLGFDLETLDASAGDKVAVKKVVYGDGSSPMITSMVQAIIDFPPMAHTGSRGALMVERDVVPVIVHVKDPAFVEEQEWRLATTRYTYNAEEDAVQHRAGRLGITPYLKVGFGRSALREVCVGPGPHPDLRRKGVESFLASQGRAGVEVTLSGVAETFR